MVRVERMRLTLSHHSSCAAPPAVLVAFRSSMGISEESPALLVARHRPVGYWSAALALGLLAAVSPFVGRGDPLPAILFAGLAALLLWRGGRSVTLVLDRERRLVEVHRSSLLGSTSVLRREMSEVKRFHAEVIVHKALSGLVLTQHRLLLETDLGEQIQISPQALADFGIQALSRRLTSYVTASRL